MNELALQKWIVDVVTERGGFAMKMSHRFLVGVPDLLIKTSYIAAPTVIEVKLVKFKKELQKQVVPEVSVLQRRYLKRMEEGGFEAFVATFVLLEGNKTLWLALNGPAIQTLAPRDFGCLGSKKADRETNLFYRLEEPYRD